MKISSYICKKARRRKGQSTKIWTKEGSWRNIFIHGHWWIWSRTTIKKNKYGRGTSIRKSRWEDSQKANGHNSTYAIKWSRPSHKIHSLSYFRLHRVQGSPNFIIINVRASTYHLGHILISFSLMLNSPNLGYVGLLRYLGFLD